ncbi:DEAD/DEAH box helicase [Microdochium bolleyi]|uniref:DEAD/DEAH box helicase n=1 Tax=Microdochium bolleyi TaxID=196109 RepID=A0A136JEH8_9PEZI|nr:DEAD/DEAH box helicase [Microdochium bolleyi]
MSFQKGLRHETTVSGQPGQQQQVTFHTTTLAGHKRSHSNNGEDFGRAAPVKAEPQKHAQFEPASRHDHNRPPRLCASAIVPDLPSLAASRLSSSGLYKGVSSTQRPLVDHALQLSHPRYGLPTQLVHNFRELGIADIYPWQKQCLMGPGLLKGEKNLVYSAPTGGGKSLVADIIMLKRVLEDKNAKALLVLPYVALVQEKVGWLRKVVQGLSRDQAEDKVPSSTPGLWRRRPDKDNIRVVGFFGGGKIRSTWADFDIGVCTFEKANTLINGAMLDCSISALKAVVLDELHMVDDDHRGYLMELMATKLISLDHSVQIVGMSATLSNIDILAKWLGAHTYVTMYRPIPLDEFLVYEGSVYPASGTKALLQTATPVNKINAEATLATQPFRHTQPERTIEASSAKELQEPVLNAVVALAVETAQGGHGALVFCSSRHGCEADARIISRAMPDAHEVPPDVSASRLDLLGELRSLSTEIDPTLEQTIPFGVAFHHAGLTTEERDLVTNAYDHGIIKVIVATCSLAAGINLPARRVILHNARMGRDLVGPSMLRQMRGRAGRKGKDEVGEAYLCCRKNDLQDVVGLMDAELPRVSSGLATEKQRIQRALLEIICIRLANSRDAVYEYLANTLLNISGSCVNITEHVEASLLGLVEMGFVTHDTSDDTYSPTQLGSAIVTSALDPEDGSFVYREIQRALKAFVLDGELHVLYTFTPVHDFAITVNWQIFRREMESLDDSELRVMTLLGLKPSIVNKMAQGAVFRESNAEEKELARIYNRFYLALQLRDLCHEMPLHVVARKYEMPRGTIQTLAQTCQGFAAGVIKFCEQMGYGAMAAILDHFSDRLRAGARSDLLALARITFIKSRTARVFYDNGFKSVASIANADPQELVPVLMQARPNKIRLKSKDEESLEAKLLAKATVITESANRLWQLEMQQELDEE